jgi:hypothetical protein
MWPDELHGASRPQYPRSRRTPRKPAVRADSTLRPRSGLLADLSVQMAELRYADDQPTSSVVLVGTSTDGTPLYINGLGATREILYGAGFALCVLAVGGSISLGQAIFINVTVSLFAGLTAVGVPNDIAVSAELIYRVISYYLPSLWGCFCLKWLEKRDNVRAAAAQEEGEATT